MKFSSFAIFFLILLSQFLEKMTANFSKTLSSMTGFARIDGQTGDSRWVWEAKSVNGKGLDIRLRLPPGFDSLDQSIRALAAKKITRGSLTLSLTIEREGVSAGYQINKALLEELIDLSRTLETEGKVETPRLDALLAVRGVVEAKDDALSPEDQKIITAALLEAATCLFDQLVTNRRLEGARLGEILVRLLQDLQKWRDAAEQEALQQPAMLKERLHAALKELLGASPSLSEERLAQELALLATKADVREELDRLKAHIQAAYALLQEDGAIGRRLDFLCQELGREANTLCAKAQALNLTRIGLELKAGIEQFREQVQNLE